MALNGDGYNVSIEALTEVNTFMNTNFKKTLSDNLQVIINVYNSLRNTDALSNEEIDAITAQIESQLTRINENYEELLARYNIEMRQTIEEVEARTKNIASSV